MYMRDINYKKVKEQTEKYRDDIIKFTQDLIRIKSLDGEEGPVINRVKKEMQKLGYDEVRIDNMGNIIGRVGQGDTVVAFDGHVDTVDMGSEKEWDLSPLAGEVKDEKIWGRGSTDQKSGVAASIYGAKIMKDLDMLDDLSVYVISTVFEEECEGLSWQYILEEEDIDPEFVVLTEPSRLTINRGHKGRMTIKITTKGLSAHGSVPHRGVNAIYKMNPIIEDIKNLNGNLKKDEFLGEGTITVTQIFFNSVSSCAVPDECSIILDRRLTAGEDKEFALNQLRELQSVKEAEAKVDTIKFAEPSYKGFVYSTDTYFPSWVISRDHPAIKAAEGGYKGLFGEDPVVDKWEFSTNGVAIKGLYDIPCVGVGPGIEVLAHAPNEYVKIDELIKATMLYSVIPSCYKESK